MNTLVIRESVREKILEIYHKYNGVSGYRYLEIRTEELYKVIAVCA